MQRIACATIIVLALHGGPARADFVTGNTSLPATKTDLTPRPITIPATKWFGAVDYNALMNASYDLRSALVAGSYHGLTLLASDPLPTNAPNYFWLKTNNQFHLMLGATDTQIAYGAVTTKGDMLVYGVTNFVVVPAGTNGQVMSADSTQSSGVKWTADADTSKPVTRVSSEAIPQYSLVKISTSANHVAVLKTSDDVKLFSGVALDAAGGAGVNIRVLHAWGIETSMISDGTTTVAIGDPVQPSLTVDGEVMKGITNAICSATSAAGLVPGTLITCQ